jgi:hypothetical protein
METFGAQAIMAMALPLLVVWKVSRQVRKMIISRMMSYSNEYRLTSVNQSK